MATTPIPPTASTPAPPSGGVTGTAGTGATPPSPPPFNLSLEILRTLQNSTLTRWANRREYEWKLSYAFWTALAGFIATVTLGKDSKFIPPPPHYLGFWLGAMVLLHIYYLYCMVDRTLQDIHAQYDIEIALHKLDPWVHETLPSKNLGAGMADRSWINKRYGLVAQIGITVLLGSAAFWFSHAVETGASKKDAFPATPIVVTCQAPPPAVSVPAAPQPAPRKPTKK